MTSNAQEKKEKRKRRVTKQLIRKFHVKHLIKLLIKVSQELMI